MWNNCLIHSVIHLFYLNLPKMIKCFVTACPRVAGGSHWPARRNFQWGRESVKGRGKCGQWRDRFDVLYKVFWHLRLQTILCIYADLCSRAVQQREYRFAVRDGPGVSDTGLWRAVVAGLQCGGLVPLASHLPPQPFSTGHRHTGPVPGKRMKWKKSHWSESMRARDLILFVLICSRVISHVAEPPSSGW